MGALERVAALVQRESGMVVRGPQLEALAGTLERIESAGDPEEFLRQVADPVTGPNHLARLIDEVTIKETFFLRHVQQLEQIQWAALLVEARAAGAERVRVWSAGCATGEEAYSLALLACEAFGTLDPPVSILATDVSGTAVARAREGEYGPRSTRELDEARRRRYFYEDGERLIVGDRIRALVTLKRHNLVSDPVPPFGEAPFDLILCRNVLIYFDAENVDRVVAALERALTRSGTLLLGAADALCRTTSRLQTLAQEGASPEAASVAGNRAFRRPLGRLGAPIGAAAPTARMGLRRQPPPLASRPRPPDQLAPLTPTEHFLHGLAALEADDPGAAVAALRRALYADPGFGLAAFQLGRAHEALGNHNPARRAYEQALRALPPDAEHLHEPLLEQIALDDVKAAARARLEALDVGGIDANPPRG